MDFIKGYCPAKPSRLSRFMDWLRVNTLSKLTVIAFAGPALAAWL